MRAAIVVALPLLLASGCGDQECEPGDDACEDEIFHIDGDEIFRTLTRWLLVAIAVLVAAVVLRWMVRWARHRWFPPDVDW